MVLVTLQTELALFTSPFVIVFCRIVSRKPKDLWAVRLSIGTYLLDGKYFKALELDEEASD